MFKNYLLHFKSQLQKPEYFFLYTASLFGVLFALIVPPLQTPDEYTHFLRSYEVSELKTPRKFSQQDGGVGSYMPKSIDTTGKLVVGDGVMGNRNVKYDIGQIKDALLNVPLSKSEVMFYKTPSAYNPIVYIPQALAIMSLKVFDSPVIVAIYAVRFVNLIVWLSILFISIRLIPWKKWGLAIFALLPMIVSQSVSTGVDVLLLGLSILMLAIILNLRESRRKVKLQDIGILVALGTVLIICKTISVVLLPLFLLLRGSQLSFRRVPAFIIKTSMILLPAFIYILLMIIPQDVITPATNLNMSGQNTSEQIKFLLGNPLWFLVVNFNMVFFNYSDTIFQGVIGVFGAYDTPLPTIFATLGYVLIAFILFTKPDSERKIKPLSINAKLVLSFTALAYVASVSLAMYIFATAVGSSLISGIQGRYYSFVPFLLLAVFVGYGVTISQSVYVRLLKYTSITLLLVSLITVFTRYYIETPTFPIL